MIDNKKNLNFGESIVVLTELDFEACIEKCKEDAIKNFKKRQEIYKAMSKHLSKMKGYRVGC